MSVQRLLAVTLLAVCLHVAKPAQAQMALYMDLAGPWRATSADDSALARSDFDDRAWPVVNLPAGNIRDRGGAKWLRRTVFLPAEAQSKPLALTVGAYAATYEVYVNGMRIGGVQAALPDQQLSRPRTFPFTPQPGEARLVIAIRADVVRSRGIGSWYVPDEGPWLLTTPEAAPRDAGIRAIERHRLRRIADLVQPLILACLAAVAWLIWFRERGRHQVLWLALLVTTEAVVRLYAFLQISENATPFGYPNVFTAVKWQLPLALLAQLAWSLLPFPRWLLGLIWLVAGASSFAVTALQWAGGSLAAQFLLAVCVVIGYLRQRDRRPWVAAGLLFTVCALGMSSNFRTIGLPVIDELGYIMGFRFSLYPLTMIVLGFLMTLDLVRQLQRDREDKLRLTADLEAARTVQRLLLPQAAPETAHSLEAAAVYEPAQVVGGDFYSIERLSGGGLLVAVGDVSGKGLKAAMVVSMLVGVLRSQRSLPPARLLEELNRTLAHGMDGGFVTCLVARLEPHGETVVANAGHLAPYADGRESAIENGLPLGLVADAVYGESRLAWSRSLTLLTDGVVEAASASGELFGFDRTLAISGEDAGSIAAAAKAWGQNDDITVVTVRRRA